MENRLAVKRAFSRAVVHSRVLPKDKEDLLVVFMLSNIKEIFKVKKVSVRTCFPIEFNWIKFEIRRIRKHLHVLRQTLSHVTKNDISLPQHCTKGVAKYCAVKVNKSHTNIVLPSAELSLSVRKKTGELNRSVIFNLHCVVKTRIYVFVLPDSWGSAQRSEWQVGWSRPGDSAWCHW